MKVILVGSYLAVSDEKDDIVGIVPWTYWFQMQFSLFLSQSKLNALIEIAWKDIG